MLSDTLEAKWIIEAVAKAQGARKVNKPLIIHSDYTEFGITVTEVANM